MVLSKLSGGALIASMRWAIPIIANTPVSKLK